MEKLKKIEEPKEDKQIIRLSIPSKTRSPLKLISCKNVKKSYGQNVVFKHLTFTLERNQKIALVGHNGAGKSTLLKLLAQKIKPTLGNIEAGPNVEFSYYAQHQLEILKKDETIYNAIESVGSRLGETEIRTYLGMFLFSGKDIEKTIGVLSGGEKARVALARMLLSPVDILLLDEPTNHLDIKARAILEKALKNYNGSIVCISHDRHFLNTVTNITVEIGQNGLKFYNGNYDYFLWKKEEGQNIKLESRDKQSHNIKRNNEFKAKKKAKNRDTWIGRRIGQIDSELKDARALLQNKSNQDNYKLLMKESEKINCSFCLFVSLLAKLLLD